nr:NIES ABC protein [Daphnia magna]
MEEAVCINDYGQGCASDGNVDFETDQLVNMDMNLERFDGSMLELDEEDLSEIHRMVDEWEFNFGALESSDGEELMKLIQIENPSQFDWPCHLGDVSPSSSNNTNANWGNTDELHDRLPSYYTALAPSRSAPWIPPSSQLVFNKLPAYITDMAPLDVAVISDNACGSVGQPGKKKLNLAEYRTRREKQLQQMQEEEEQQQQQQQKQEDEDKEKQEIEKKDDVKRVKVQMDKMQCHTKQHRQAGGYSDRSQQRRHQQQQQQQTERQRQIEERRVIYVGKLADGTTRSDLRQRFEPFGPVVDISLHFRERGDNYGFVTFAYKVDAYEAVEHGNDDPHLPKYDLSFGGRRAFCKETYADLDAVDDDGRSKANDVDFETLLRAVQVQLTRRPCS